MIQTSISPLSIRRLIKEGDLSYKNHGERLWSGGLKLLIKLLYDKDHHFLCVNQTLDQGGRLLHLFVCSTKLLKYTDQHFTLVNQTLDQASRWYRSSFLPCQSDAWSSSCMIKIIISSVSIRHLIKEDVYYNCLFVLLSFSMIQTSISPLSIRRLIKEGDLSYKHHGERLWSGGLKLLRLYIVAVSKQMEALGLTRQSHRSTITSTSHAFLSNQHRHQRQWQWQWQGALMTSTPTHRWLGERVLHASRSRAGARWANFCPSVCGCGCDCFHVELLLGQRRRRRQWQRQWQWQRATYPTKTMGRGYDLEDLNSWSSSCMIKIIISSVSIRHLIKEDVYYNCVFVLLRRTFTTSVCLFYFGGRLLQLFVCSTSEEVYYNCLFVLLRRTFTTIVCLFYFRGSLLQLFVCFTFEDVYYKCLFVLLRRTFTTIVCLFYFGRSLLQLFVCFTSEDVYYKCLFYFGRSLLQLFVCSTSEDVYYRPAFHPCQSDAWSSFSMIQIIISSVSIRRLIKLLYDKDHHFLCVNQTLDQGGRLLQLFVCSTKLLNDTDQHFTLVNQTLDQGGGLILQTPWGEVMIWRT